MNLTNTLLIGAAIVFVLVLASVVFGGGTRGPFYNFKGPDVVTGKMIDTSAYQGQIRLIHFWSTTCPACKQSMSMYVGLVNKYKSDVIPIDVALDYNSSKELLKQIIKNYGITYPVICNGLGWRDPAATKNFIDAIPKVILVDQNGVTRYKGRDLRKLEKELKKLLGK